MKKTTNKARISDDFYVQHLMDFYKSNLPLNCFCTKQEILRRRQSLQQVSTAINLFEHKKDNAPYSFVHGKLLNYLKQKSKDDEKRSTNYVKKIEYLLQMK